MTPEGTGTTPVTFEVTRIDPVSRGRLMALATVRVEVAGVEFVLQGLPATLRPDGFLVVEPPQARRSDGTRCPAVILPNELLEAIAREIAAELKRQDGTG
ncbi:MAG TPA: hypothetical protein VEB64_09435 [Azospirillaceae bacterium]|nr:hypothetical protein [Azospirillaceae bacterium]